jgi:hypothetical protein
MREPLYVGIVPGPLATRLLAFAQQ